MALLIFLFKRYIFSSWSPTDLRAAVKLPDSSPDFTIERKRLEKTSGCFSIEADSDSPRTMSAARADRTFLNAGRFD